jgi:hypothetical protein
VRVVKIVTAAALLSCAVHFSVPAAAEEAPAQVPAEAPAKKSSADIYYAYVRTLTDAQKAELEQLEKDFMVTLQPDIAILSTGTQLQYCSDTNPAFKAKEAEYGPAFIAWRDKVNAWQHTLWKPLQARRSRMDYIPQDILGNYLEYSARLFLVLGKQLIDLGRDAGGFKDLDCMALGQELLSGTKPTQWTLEQEKSPENGAETAK